MIFKAVENKPTEINEALSKLVEDEALHLFNLMVKDIVKDVIFHSNERSTLIIECKNITVAKEIINSFPMVRKGFRTFEIIL